MASAQAKRGDFSHVVDTQRLSENGDDYSAQLVPTAEQLATLKERLGVRAVRAFKGRITLLPHGGVIHVSGQVDAVLVRLCVCTLEEVEETVQEYFDFTLQDVRQTDFAPGAEIEGMLDSPDLFMGPNLDLADQLVQQVVLFMEPYPKRQDVSPINSQYPPEEDSPFMVLENYKHKP